MSTSAQYGMQRPPGTAPEAWMMQLLSGFMASQYVHAAAKLGLADLLSNGPRSAAELSAACGADEAALVRLLRVLASMGVFAEAGDGRFETTALAAVLRADHPSALRGIALFYGQEWIWRAYGALEHSLRTGRPAFEHVFGQGFYDHLAGSPEAARVFADAMSGFAAMQARQIVQEYDFGRFRRVMDVGGNHGAFLVELLRACPGTRGVLFDAAQVVEAAVARLARIEAGVRDRIELAAGDFLREVPPGCDAYILRNTLQDWDDERAHVLLTRCRDAMPARSARSDGRPSLLVVGRLLEPGNEPHPGKFTDMTMMVLTGGRERTRGELCALLAGAGFVVGSITRTAAMVAVVEATVDGARR
jgi:multifunctional cyclase/dehydratase/O-methyltransferase